MLRFGSSRNNTELKKKTQNHNLTLNASPTPNPVLLRVISLITCRYVVSATSVRGIYRDGRQSWPKMAEIMAEICDSHEIHGTIMAKSQHR